MGAGLAGPHLGGRGGIGLGYLLAQQLVAAGEWVLDIQPKLAEFNDELKVGRAMTARRSSGRGTIRRIPRHQEAPHEGRARPAGLAGLVWAKPRTAGTPATSAA